MTAPAWFRLYGEVVEDPKVQRLPAPLFKTWINVLCIASRHGGSLPTVDDLAFTLRQDAGRIKNELAALVGAGLLEDRDGRLAPHNWTGRQFQSDHSAERMKRHRDRHKQRNGDGGETATNSHGERHRDSQGDVHVTSHVTAPETEQRGGGIPPVKGGNTSTHPPVVPPPQRSARNGPAAAASQFVALSDPRWPTYARAFRAAHEGRDPPVMTPKGKAQPGWFFEPIPEVDPVAPRRQLVTGNGAEEDRRDKVFVTTEDPRWKACAEAYAASHDGKQPPVASSPAADGRVGWWFVP